MTSSFFESLNSGLLATKSESRFWGRPENAIYQARCNLRVTEGDDVVIGTLVAQGIDVAIPHAATVDDGASVCKVGIDGNVDAVELQPGGVGVALARDDCDFPHSRHEVY